MSRLRLLPGEKELVRLRPAPAAWLGRYFLGLLWLAWGLFAFTAIGPSLTDVSMPARIGLLVSIPSLPLVIVGLIYATRGLWLRFGLGCAGALAAAPALFLSPNTRIIVVLAAFSTTAVVALLLTEVDRRFRSYHMTNLRVLHHGGLWDRHGWTVHYDAILDVDSRQSPVGRLLGYGSLEPVLARSKTVAAPTKRRKIAVPSMSDIDTSAPPRLVGVSPYNRVRHLVGCFIQDATATPYLKTEQDTARRVTDAIRAIAGANVLRR